MYEIRILETASRQLGRLDRTVAKRVVSRIRWLRDNLEAYRPQPLTGDLAGLFKLRVGDYRVIYEVLSEEEVLLVHFVGHRREVYRRK